MGVDKLDDLFKDTLPWFFRHPTGKLSVRLEIVEELGGAAGCCEPEGGGYVIKVRKDQLQALDISQLRALLVHELLHAIIGGLKTGKLSSNTGILEGVPDTIDWARSYDDTSEGFGEEIVFNLRQFEHLLVELATLLTLLDYEPEALPSANVWDGGPCREYEFGEVANDGSFKPFPPNICDRLEVAFDGFFQFLKGRIAKIRREIEEQNKVERRPGHDSQNRTS